MTPVEDFIVRTTAAVCVGLYLVACLVALKRSAADRTAKIWWTAGWVMLIVHTAAAFHYRHDWSPLLAADHVAQRTEQVVGFYWAGGIWFNYALLLAWGIDVALLWTIGAPKVWTLFVHAFLAMMVISATVVFGPAYWWIAAVLFGAACWFALRGRIATAG